MGLFRLDPMGGMSPLGRLRVAACASVLALIGALNAPGADISVTVDGSQTFQVIDGFGVNANHRSFTNNEITPVLDALIDQAGMTLFRVVFDNADWEAANDNADSHTMNWSYYNSVYSSPDFQKMWNMMAYLNQKGITNGLMPNFQGFGPAWMGGFSLTPGFEDEWAEMVASALVYARKTNHLQFTLVGPNNEPDLPGTGVGIADGQQYALTLHKLSQQLDANGLGDIRFVGPDRSDSGTNWLPEIMSDPLVMSKLAHFGLHSYSDYGTWSYGVNDFIQQSPYPNSTFWMTEYNVWCETCQNSISGTNSWDYAFGTAEYLLYHLANNASAGLVWEGYDSYYFNNYDSNMHWSYWGLFAVNDIKATPKTYSPRKAFYTVSQISKFVRPGAKRIFVSGTGSSMLLLGFYHPETKQFTLTGINYDDNGANLTADLSNLPGVTNLELFVTTASANLSHLGSVGVTNGTFSTALPGYSVFTLVGSVPAAITINAQPEGQIVRNGGAAKLAVDAVGSAALAYQWQRNGLKIAGATNSALTLAKVNPANAGTYRVLITSTGSTLLSSNAVLLVDQKNPSISVTAPRSGTRLTQGEATFSGKSTDDTGAVATFYQLNGGPWLPATGVTTWSAATSLIAGSNVFRVYSIDAVGNRSSTNTILVTYVVNAPLTLVTNGVGRITGNFKTNWLEIGKTYTVTATPATGQVFSNWVGSASSTASALSFVMQSNMVLQANFIPNPFLRAQGNYNGLFSETNREHAHSGFFTFTMGGSGGYSLRLQIGTTNYSATGQLPMSGILYRTLTARSAPNLALAIAVDLAGGSNIVGNVGDGNWLADLTALRAPFDAKTNKATPFLGRFNVMVPGGMNTGTAYPEGDGFCTMGIDLAGHLTLAGALADNSGLSYGAGVSANGDLPIYVPLYGGKGSLFGWLQCDTNQPANSVSGWLSWIKPAQAATYYPGGLTNLLAVEGPRYTPPTGTNRIIGVTRAYLILDGGNTSSPVTNALTFSTANRVTNGSLSNRLSLTITLGSGVFSGSVIPAGTSRALPIQGAFYQDVGAGYGFFLGTNQSGRVYIGP